MSYPVISCNCGTCQDSRKLSQQLALIAIAFTVLIAVVLILSAMTDSRRVSTLPACIEEDGSGQTYMCVWTDTDTGNLYVNN